MITVTIPSTGETLALPQISVAMLKSQLTRKHPKPSPPKQQVMMFGEERWEENPDAAGNQAATACVVCLRWHLGNDTAKAMGVSRTAR
jgi:hypothetical protein